MKKKTDRILWVDIFKGILIVLMVLAHTKNPMTHYIYAFHMRSYAIENNTFNCFFHITTAQIQISCGGHINIG